MEESTYLRLIMSSGERIFASHVMLYPEPEIQQVQGIKAKAHQEMGGFSTGLGIWGSPGWVIGGAAALGMLESIVSGSKMKKGLQLLKDASAKLEKAKAKGEFFAISEISGIEDPNPAGWSAIRESELQIDLNPLGMLEKGEIMNQYKITRRHIRNGIATVSAPVPHIQFENEFVWIKENEEPRAIRWTFTESYVVVPHMD